jgi:hypothetical protein
MARKIIPMPVSRFAVGDEVQYPPGSHDYRPRLDRTIRRILIDNGFSWMG